MVDPSDEAADRDGEHADQGRDSGEGPFARPVPRVHTLERLSDHLSDYQERLMDAVEEAEDREEVARIASYALMQAETTVRRMADDSGERVPVSAFESGRTDDRGRISLGPEYAEESVYVAVLKLEDVPVEYRNA